MNEQTLTGALERAFDRWPDRPALFFRGKTTTYAELASAVATLASAYRQLGIGRGDRIICQLANGPEHVVAAAAAWACAAVHVGANHELTGRELSEYVRLTGAKVLVYSPVTGSSDSFLPMRVVQEDHPDVHLLVIDNSAPTGSLSLSKLTDLASTTSLNGCMTPDGPSPDDPAAIFTTSGTTGKPKTPLGYHGKLVRSWRGLAEQLAFCPEDVHLVQLPLAHGFGLMLATAGLIAGGQLILVERFSAETALAVIERERITVLNGTPAHFTLVLGRVARERRDVSSLRIGVASGAGFSPSLLREIFDGLKMELMLMYGSSEGVGVMTTERAEMLRGSVGRPEPGSVEIVGTDGRALPPGEVGEIAFSRNAFPVRYWRDPSDELGTGAGDMVATGWYYSGDLGRLDTEGRLYVVGRLKRQINRGGMKIDPVEVENALLQCDGVVDVAVLAMPNPVLGEVICACLVLVPGQVPNLDGLRTALRRNLAPYKLPDELRIFDRIPRTGLGKIDLALLRAEAVARPVRQRVRIGEGNR